MVQTWKNKFNRKHGFPSDESHSLDDISKISGYNRQGLQTIFNKGIGAYKTNPESVRPSVKSPEQWAYARVYSAVMGGKAADVDRSHLMKKDILRVRLGKKTQSEFTAEKKNQDREK